MIAEPRLIVGGVD